jgi:hypothetical protein
MISCSTLACMSTPSDTSTDGAIAADAATGHRSSSTTSPHANSGRQPNLPDHD